MEFDGIDLDEIANADSVTDATDIKTEEVDITEEIKAEKEDKKEDDANEGEDSDAIDLDVLEDSDNVVEDGEEKEKAKGNNKAPSNSTANFSSPDKFTSLASALREEGALGILEDEDFSEIKNSTELIEAMSKHAKASMYEDVLNDDQRQYLDAMESGVPQAIFQDRKAELDQYQALTDERIAGSTALTEELIKRSYVADGLSVEKATKFAARDMEGEYSAQAGIEARNALVASESAKLNAEIETSRAKKEEGIRDATANLAALKSKVNEATDVIPGVKVNATTRGRVFKSMTENVGKRGESPMNALMKEYETDEGFKIKLHTLYALTNGLKDFSKFTKSKQSDIAAKLDAKLGSTARTAGTPVGVGTGATTNHISATLAHWEYGKE